VNNAKISESMEQGELVTGDEASFTKQPRDLLEKSHRALGRDRPRQMSYAVQ